MFPPESVTASYVLHSLFISSFLISIIGEIISINFCIFLQFLLLEALKRFAFEEASHKYIEGSGGMAPLTLNLVPKVGTW
jgi:hypothetical protein